MSERLPCGNGDSCEPGTEHVYPSEGATVVTKIHTTLPVVGGNGKEVSVVAGQQGIVTEHIIEGAHQVGVRFAFTDDIVWADVTDDITPVEIDCEMVYDGTDTDGSVWNRCTIHDQMVFGDAYVCEGWNAPPYTGMH